MTIHSDHPFLEPQSSRDAARRLRARTGGVVSLWTSGEGEGQAGLTVSSMMVATGEPAEVLALVDPDADLFDALEQTGRAVVQLLRWEHHQLADVFAGVIPAPNGVEVTAEIVRRDPSARVLILSASGEQADVLAAVKAGATGYLVKSASRPELLDAVRRVAAGDTVFTPGLAGLVLGEEPDPLVHRRGRYLPPAR